MYFPDAGTQFLSDQIEHYVIAASSQLPCPACLTGLMQDVGEWWVEANDLTEYGSWDAFQCGSCQKRVLIERDNVKIRDAGRKRERTA